MTDRQKLLSALVSKPDPHVGAGLSVLEVAALLERVRDIQCDEASIAS